MGATDEQLVRDEIATGLQTLKSDFAQGMEEQDAAMKEQLRKRRAELEVQAAALETQLVNKWAALNQSLVALQDQQVAAAQLHNTEIDELTTNDRQVRAVLRTSMETIGQSLAAAKASFQESEGAVQAAQTNGFKELLAKLNSAVQVLQSSGVQLGADVDDQVNNVTTRLRTVRADVQQAQSELAAAVE